jgi:hypothetical protein
MPSLTFSVIEDLGMTPRAGQHRARLEEGEDLMDSKDVSAERLPSFENDGVAVAPG